MQIQADSSITRAFLEHTPFIFERFGELVGAVFLNGETPLTVEAIREIDKQHFHAGMAKLVLFQFLQQVADGGSRPAPALPPDRMDDNVRDSTDPLRFRQMPRADWMELIHGLGCTGVCQAVAIYPQRED
jgi:hypothetical protein